jgi:hypothetical protein
MATLTEWITKRREILDNGTEPPWIAEYSGITGHCVLPHDAEDAREALALTRSIYAGYDAVLIADGRTALPLALDAIEAEARRHYPVEVEPSETICGECSLPKHGGTRGRYLLLQDYPCPPLQTIAAALDVDP